MAMVQCSECKQKISSGAKVCPHCGKRRTSFVTKGIAGLLAFGVVGSILASHNQSEKEAERIAALTPEQRQAEAEKKAKQERLDAAIGICDLAVQKSLYNPDSAKLDESNTWYAEEKPNGIIHVQPSGRAKNSFGAYIYGVWDCQAKAEGEKIKLLSLKQIRP